MKSGQESVGDIAVDRGRSFEEVPDSLGQRHDVKQELEDYKNGMLLTVDQV